MLRLTNHEHRVITECTGGDNEAARLGLEEFTMHTIEEFTVDNPCIQTLAVEVLLCNADHL